MKKVLFSVSAIIIILAVVLMAFDQDDTEQNTEADNKQTEEVANEVQTPIDFETMDVELEAAKGQEDFIASIIAEEEAQLAQERQEQEEREAQQERERQAEQEAQEERERQAAQEEQEQQEQQVAQEEQQESQEQEAENENIQQVSNETEASGETMYMTATAYTAHCDGCSGTTYTGQDLRANPNQKVIAVDPNVIPLGSKVWVEGYGTAIAGDIGGAIKGNKIDLFMADEEEALRYGVRQVRVEVIE
ncbi:3D domain-containing protein [Halalkalibacillus halophilus]|uniref:3D domain-containing protein n=1 Tax=Halalkalibacillus halophilus TaxID=392827 RepID=UPI00040097AD|nr:3D domain-containing protein [Halalkalibacillus halophilus]